MPHEEALDRVLSDFVHGTPGARHALVVTVDGLRRGRSEQLPEGVADALAAAACSIVNLAGGAADLIGLGPAGQTIVGLAGGHLFLSRMPGGETLAVVAGNDCDMGRVGYEMTLLGARVADLRDAPGVAR